MLELIKSTKKIGVTLSLIMLCACSGKDERQADYLSKAQQLFNDEDIVKAEIEVKNALQINGDNGDARYLLAQIMEKKKNWQQMYGHLKYVIDMDPQHVRANVKLAQMYYKNQRYEDALKHVEAVLEIEPNNADAHMLNGSISLQNGELDRAVHEANRALSVEPDHVGAISLLTEVYKQKDPSRALELIQDSLKTLGKDVTLQLIKIDLLESKGDVDSVVATYKELIEQYPNSYILHYRLVESLKKYRRFDEAERVIQEAIKAEPDDIKLKMWLVEFVMQNEDIAQAEAILKDFVVKEPDVVDFQFALAAMYAKSKKVLEAKEVYHQIISHYDEGAEGLRARNKLVTLAMLDSDRKRAEALIEEILAVEKENTQALMMKARLALVDQDTKTAVANLRIVVKNSAKPIEALRLLAKAQKSIGAHNLALDNYRQLLSLNPADIEALVGAAALELRFGNGTEAEALLDAALRQDAEHSEATRLLVAVYAKQKRWDEGLAKAEKLIADPFTEAMGHFLMGRLLLATEELDKIDSAIEALKTSLAIQPSGIQSLGGLLEAYRQKDDMKTAAEYLELHVKDFPQHVHAHRWLYEITSRTDASHGIDILKDAIKHNPQNVGLQVILAKAYERTEQYELALNSYKAGLELSPSDTASMLGMANVLRIMGDYVGTEQMYQRILASQPDARAVEIASNNLAMLYVDELQSEENLQKALELANKLDGVENVHFLDTLGTINSKLGRDQMAISYFKSAIRLGGDGDVHYRLAEAYYKVGELALAKNELQQATDKGVDSKHENGLQQLMERLNDT